MKLKFFAPLIVVALVAVAVNIGINIPTWRYNRMMETAPRVYGTVESVSDSVLELRIKFVDNRLYPEAADKLMVVQRDEIFYPDNGTRFDEFAVGDPIFVVFDGVLFGSERITAEDVRVLYSMPS